MNTYIENDSQLGANICWNGSELLFSQKTSKGTLLEFIKRPKWGISCFMNGCIQSCLMDELIYHQALVRPSLVNDCSGQAVAIFGGGEGATAREVLRYDSVYTVDMIEWDADVITAFTSKFPQWAQGSWNDRRLNVIVEDVFTHISTIHNNMYNVAIVDLFEPDDQTWANWTTLFSQVYRILKNKGNISMYAGIYDYYDSGKTQQMIRSILSTVGFKYITMRKVFIPSYLGQACFIAGVKVDESDRE